jgi:hypothetical protein
MNVQVRIQFQQSFDNSDFYDAKQVVTIMYIFLQNVLN